MNAKNECIAIGNTTMDYVSFGKGDDNLILIPGLGDGLHTVKGLAFTLSMMNKVFAKDYRVYVFSRKNDMPTDYTTRDMARDLAEVLQKLGIAKCSIMGVSQGGMIAQYLAIDNPDLVQKLILTVTLSKQNEMVQTVIGNWISLAKQNDYKGIMIDLAEHSYSEKYLKNRRLLYALMARIGKPKSFTRFIIQANSCLTHNAYNELVKITCPTLIIGGEDDKIVSVESSIEMNHKITGSKLFIYKEYGHGAYDEARDFNQRVLAFLKEK